MHLTHSKTQRILGESDMTVSTIPVENYEEVQEYCKKLELDGVMVSGQSEQQSRSHA